MRLLVVGGRLQGTEAVYLAAKAGYETFLVDRSPAPPAAGLADRHIVADVTADETLSASLARTCDAILPACEDDATLAWLNDRAPVWGVPLLFDTDAYQVTRSKHASRRLFETLGIARPESWPACGFPVVVKPDNSSGSQGVIVAEDESARAMACAELAAAGHEVLLEGYVNGPALSLEVIAWNGRGVPLQITGLEFDAAYDCKRVVAPGGEAASGVLERFTAMSQCLAEGLALCGVMDVEVVVRDGFELQVLEIDARLPSQTPTAVYWSSGLNVIELLVEMALRGAPPALRCSPRRACVYQHVRARDGRLEVVGEHELAHARPLSRFPGFFGADEGLTDRVPGATTWVATLITTGPSVGEARVRGARAIGEIAREDGLELEPEQEPGARLTVGA